MRNPENTAVNTLLQKFSSLIRLERTKHNRTKTWRTFKGFLEQHKGSQNSNPREYKNENRRGLNLLMEDSYGYRLTNRAKKKFKKYVAWKDRNDARRFDQNGI